MSMSLEELARHQTLCGVHDGLECSCTIKPEAQADLLDRLASRISEQTGPAVILSEADKMRIAVALEALAILCRAGILPEEFDAAAPVGSCE